MVVYITMISFLVTMLMHEFTSTFIPNYFSFINILIIETKMWLSLHPNNVVMKY